MADDIVVDVVFRGNASEFLAELSRAVGRAKTQLQELGQTTAPLSRLENQLARMSGTAKQAGASVTSGLADPFKQADASMARAQATLSKYAAEQRAISPLFTQNKTAMAEWDAAFKSLNNQVNRNQQAMNQARAAVEKYQHSLSNTRYVLYDVAGTFTILGGAMVVPLAATIGVAIKFEKAFAQVARTSGLAGEELAELKEAFDDLYATIPVGYDDLAKIATLAGQLGVPAGQIADFTEIVAKTSAVTDLTVDDAATAFGRLNALIPNVQGQYDRLGSAIAKVGVNSVATESEIVNISTQISAMGAFAGLTGQDIIGLSGALASIGAKPELSRGTITRVFTLMSRAVASGGAELEKFASLSGMSAAEFSRTWGTPEFGNTFLQFMGGIRNEGNNAVAALNDLGITSVRDVPLLLRLANAADSTGKAGALLAQTMNDANSGWAENIELQRQYSIIAATVAAKFDVLTNKFNLFLQAVGAPALDALGQFIDALSGVVDVMTEVAKSDLGGAIFRVIGVIGALLGVLALAAGAMALFGASSIGVYQALLFVAAQSPRTAAAIVGVTGAAKLADGSLKAGAASALAFSRALKLIGVVGALALVPEVLGAIGNGLDEMNGWIGDIEKRSEQVFGTSGFFGNVSFSTIPLANARNVFSDFANNIYSGGRAFKELDSNMHNLLQGGDIQGVADMLNKISESSAEFGTTDQSVLDYFSNIAQQAKDAGFELKVVGDEIVVAAQKGSETSEGYTVVGGNLMSVEEAAAEAEQALSDYKAALEAINSTQLNASAAADALQGSINKLNEAASAEGATLNGKTDESIALRDALREVETDARLAADAILANGGSTEEAKKKWDDARESVLGILKGMGLTREEAILWADTQLGKAEEVYATLKNLKGAYESQPEFVQTEYKTPGLASALFQTMALRNTIFDIPAYKQVTVGYRTTGDPIVAHAAGGRIFGPGTGTSDSILSLLSNGEYVVREAAARAIGYGRLDYLNRYGKLPAFANGGQVGGSPSPSFPSSMMVELSPADRMNMWGSGSGDGNIVIQLDSRVLAQAVRSQTARDQKRGK